VKLNDLPIQIFRRHIEVLLEISCIYFKTSRKKNKMARAKRGNSFPSPVTPKRNKNSAKTKCVEDECVEDEYVEDIETDFVVTPKRNKRTNYNEDAGTITPKRNKRVDPMVTVLITPKKNERPKSKTRTIASNYMNEAITPGGEQPVVTVLITPKKNNTQFPKQIVTPPSIR
jgi:hypothetical protein